MDDGMARFLGLWGRVSGSLTIDSHYISECQANGVVVIPDDFG